MVKRKNSWFSIIMYVLYVYVFVNDMLVINIFLVFFFKWDICVDSIKLWFNLDVRDYKR